MEEIEPINPETPLVPDSKKPKRKKVWLIITIIIVLLLLIAGGFYYWFFVKEKPPINNTPIEGTTSKAEEPIEKPDYAKELIDKIRTAEAALVTNYPQIKVEDSEAQSPAYQPSGEQYYIAGKIGYALLVSDPSESTNTEGFNAATETAATSVLDANKALTKTGSDMTVRYESADVVCSISHASYPFYASCANVRDYADLEIAIEPFAEAFKKGDNAQYIASSVFGSPTIVLGQDGYKNASLSIGTYEGIGGYAGLYYGKDSWTFWRGTQSYISCEDFNTIELQKSFVGSSCYDEADEKAKVKVTI